jgi:hypothetical protein
VDLWLALRRFAEALTMLFGDRLDEHDAPLERARRSQLAHTTQYRGRGSFSRRRVTGGRAEAVISVAVLLVVGGVAEVSR